MEEDERKGQMASFPEVVKQKRFSFSELDPLEEPTGRFGGDLFAVGDPS